MAIVRAEIPTVEEVLMRPGMVADACVNKRYTLLHGGRYTQGTLYSNRQRSGFSERFESTGPDSIRFTLGPNGLWLKGAVWGEFILRICMSESSEVQRYMLPNDQEFTEQTFEIGEHATREVCWGLVEEVHGQCFYLNSVLWLDDKDPRALHAKGFRDAWSE